MKRMASIIVFVFLCCSMASILTSKAYAQGAPIINSVTAISSATDLQIIYISGSGFGNTPPQVVVLSDGSVDTVVNSTTPSLAISDYGKWTAGIENDSFVNCDIGILIDSWSDNEIVLDGFGTALGTNGQGTSNIATGDILRVQVNTPYGDTSYNVTVGSSSTPEFSSFLILPLFMIAILPVIVVCRKRMRPDSRADLLNGRINNSYRTRLNALRLQCQSNNFRNQYARIRNAHLMHLTSQLNGTARSNLVVKIISSSWSLAYDRFRTN